MGILRNNVCAFPYPQGNDVALSVSEKLDNDNFMAPYSFKFYVPAGTTRLSLSGFAPQRTAYAYALKFGQAPTRAAVNAADYLNALRLEYSDNGFSKLIGGEEIVTVHDGGGTIRFPYGSAVSSGGWVYAKKLTVLEAVHTSSYVLQPADQLYRLQWSITADKASFINHYRQIQWQANGDPQ